MSQHSQEPSLICTGSDSDGGSRSRILVGHARRRRRTPQGRCPRLRSVPVETGEKHSDLSRGRVSQNSVPCPGPCWRPKPPGRLAQCSIMMPPTAAQADHSGPEEGPCIDSLRLLVALPRNGWSESSEYALPPSERSTGCEAWDLGQP